MCPILSGASFLKSHIEARLFVFVVHVIRLWMTPIYITLTVTLFDCMKSDLTFGSIRCVAVHDRKYRPKCSPK